MQMRADFRRGNLRRDEKPGSAEVRGRHQTPDQSRDGKMPGRFLPDQSNRTLAREFGTDWTEIHLRGEASPILLKKNREEAEKGR